MIKRRVDRMNGIKAMRCDAMRRKAKARYQVVVQHSRCNEGEQKDER